MARKKKRKDWTENMISYSNTGNPGLCPFCNSPNVEVYIMKIGRGSINFHCLSCDKRAHIDGCKYEKEERDNNE